MTSGFRRERDTWIFLVGPEKKSSLQKKLDLHVLSLCVKERRLFFCLTHINAVNVFACCHLAWSPDTK